MKLTQITADAGNASCYQENVQPSAPVSLLLDQEEGKHGNGCSLKINVILVLDLNILLRNPPDTLGFLVSCLHYLWKRTAHGTFYGGAKNVCVTTESISAVVWVCSVGKLLGCRLLSSANSLNLCGPTQLWECQTQLRSCEVITLYFVCSSECSSCCWTCGS
jgi:hypothetical protein